MQDRSPSLHGVASQVHSLLSKSGALDYFRDRVREAAQEHIQAMAECERREKLRREAAAKEGVWEVVVDAAVAKKKREERYFRWSEVFQGRIKLPPGIKKPLMGLTHRAEFPNRPMEPRCLREHIPRGEWSEKDEREVEEFRKKLKGWEEKKAAYVTGPKKKGKWQKGPSELEKDWRSIFELAQKRGFPDDGDDGLEYVFEVVAWLPDKLSEDKDPATDGPLPVSKKKMETSLNFKYAGLAAIYDAHWDDSERIAPWDVVTSDGEVSPASGLPSEWKTPEKPGSYRAASWYCQLVMAAEDLDDRNTTIVNSWVAYVENDLRENGPKKALVEDLPDKLQKLIKDLPPDHSVRVAYRRDHLWLKWKDQLSGEGRCNAEIRDRWNGLSDAHRKIISPRLPDTIGTDRSGAETVRSGIRKAEKELKEMKPKSVRGNAKKPRSRKNI